MHWDNITNKPSTYSPSSHTHGSGDITFNTNIIPNTNNNYDLGSSSLKYKDGYFAGKLNSGQIYFSPTIEDKISLHDNRLGQTAMYGFGIAAIHYTLRLREQRIRVMSGILEQIMMEPAG